MQRADSLEKTLMLGKIEGKRGRRWQGMRMLESITDSMHMNLSKLWKVMEDREPLCATVHEVAKSQSWLSDWTTFSLSSTPKLCHLCLYLCIAEVDWKVFPPTSSHSLTQNGVLQVNAILSLATWSSSRPHRYKSSVPQDCPHFRCQLQELHPKLPVFCLIWLQSQRFPQSPSLNAK